jgi:hypothetical protein
MGSKTSPATLELHNRSEWDENYLRQVVQWIITDLELTGRIKFWFMNVWTELTDDGELIPGTERDHAFDGDWTEGGIVRVVISDRISYYPDCGHSLAGQVVEMVAIAPGDHEERD